MSVKNKKIISWNVNGIRASERKGALKSAFALNPDILCLQETKATKEQLVDSILNVEGFFSFFESPKFKKGYSGVAIYTKEKPKKVIYGIEKPGLDEEGRAVTLFFDDFVLINCYFPNGGGGEERLKYKLDFYDQFLIYVDKIRKQNPHIIFCGDINTAHFPIDLARPKENEKNTGFLPVEREWLDTVVSSGYIDVFRHFYPNKKDAYTYWDQKTMARERNVGWRIDYFFISPALLPRVKSTKIYSDIFGSDHCPIEMVIS